MNCMHPETVNSTYAMALRWVGMVENPYNMTMHPTKAAYINHSV